MFVKSVMATCLGSSSFFATLFTSAVLDFTEAAKHGMAASQNVLLNGTVVGIVGLLFIVTFIGFIVAMGMWMRSAAMIAEANARSRKESEDSHAAIISQMTMAQNERVRTIAERMDRQTDMLKDTVAEHGKNIHTIIEGHVRAVAFAAESGLQQVAMARESQAMLGKEIGALRATIAQNPCLLGSGAELLGQIEARVTKTHVDITETQEASTGGKVKE